MPSSPPSATTIGRPSNDSPTARRRPRRCAGGRQGPHRRDDGEPRPRAHGRLPRRLHRAAGRPCRQPDERPAARRAAGHHRTPRPGDTRLMLASTLAGEAAAAAVIRDLLKHDETIKLPPAEAGAPGPAARPPDAASADVKARRLDVKRRKQAEARARREQSARAGSRLTGSAADPVSDNRTASSRARRRAVVSTRSERQLEPGDLALVVQQPGLRLQAAAEAREAAVTADDAVAGQDDGDRVAAVGCADGPRLASVTQPSRLLAVAHGRRERDRRQPCHAVRWNAEPRGSRGTSNSTRSRRSTRRAREQPAPAPGGRGRRDHRPGPRDGRSGSAPRATHRARRRA